MADVKIRVFKSGGVEPETTVTIPGNVLHVASRLIPKRAAAALHDEGINLEEIVELSKDEEIRGTILEVEQHAKQERVVVSLE